MAVKIRLHLPVEALGCTFYMRPHDGSWARFIKFAAQFAAVSGMSLGEVDVDTDTSDSPEVLALFAKMPAEMIEALCDLFVQGCVGWKGVLIEKTGEDGQPVLGEDGQPLVVAAPCNLETKRAMEPQDKLVIALAYVSAAQEVEAKKAPPASPTTDGTPLPA
jgi:hypothetical protein